LAGKYQLLRKIAQGGMAEVYLAKQTGLEGFEKLVVVKRILPHLIENEEFVRMFLDEARTAADLRHPNVVQIFEIGEDAGTYFIVMEFLHGQDVRRVLRRAAELGKRVPPAHGLQIIIDAANGLDYAHKKQDLQGRALNIIHRDISPQNIIVTYDGTTKIVDFGIAKAASQSVHTASGVLKGKYSYMSPEQASGGEMDQRTDQFALGIVLYETMTMTRLFKLQNEIMTLHAIIECNIKPPQDVLPDFPQELNNIIMKALSRRREDRFKDCRELGEALEEFLAEERVLHSPGRLSSYMNELFKDELAQEKALGMPVIDQEGSDSKSAPAGTQKGRRNTGSAPGTPSGAGAAPTRARTGATPAQNAAELQAAGTLVTSSQMMAASTRALSRSGSGAGPVTAGDGDFQSLPTAATGISQVSQVGRGETNVTGLQPGSESRRRLLLGGLGVVGLLALAAGGIYVATSGPSVGRLTVRTIPTGAKVLLDGKPLADKTPLIIPDLKVGQSYALRAELPGHAPAVKDVRVSGEDTQEISFTLTKEGPSAALRFKTTPPGARVYLDGRPLDGVTPLELPPMPLDQDTHVATFSLEGHGDETRRFSLKEGLLDVGATLTRVTSQESKGRINITSTPPGATIVMGGKVLGQAPLQGVEVTGGKAHAISARLAGHETQERLVDVDKGATVDVVFELDREAQVDTGTLTLDSSPTDCTVYLEKGRNLGKTPLKKVKVPAGTLTLRLVHDRKGVDFSARVKVDKDQDTRQTIVVPKGRLKVVVRSWADVYVDGTKIGTTPFGAKDLFAGKHEVRLVNPKLGKDERESVLVKPGEDAKVKRDW